MVGISLKENGSGSQERGIGHYRKWASDIGDLEYRGGGEDLFELVEGCLLEGGPLPRFAFSGEEVQGCDNVGETGDEFPVEICKSSERSYPFH